MTIPKIIVTNKRITPEGEYIGRPSPLGNPFTHMKGNTKAEHTVASREEAIKRYEDWLHEKIASENEAILSELRRLYELARKNGELTLVCWCKPAPCHGDVIKSVLKRAFRKNQEE